MVLEEQENGQQQQQLLLLCPVVSQILSDDHHRASFICTCCDRLIHPSLGRVCTACWKVQCGASAAGGRTTTMNNKCTFCTGGGGSRGEKETQQQQQRPLDGLAVKVLSRIQVTCLACDWYGNYGEYWDHQAKAHGNKTRTTPSENNDKATATTRSTQPIISSSPSSEGTIQPKGLADEKNEQMWNELEALDVSRGDVSEEGNGNDDIVMEDDDEEDEMKNFNDWNTSINSNMGFWTDNTEESESNCENGEISDGKCGNNKTQHDYHPAQQQQRELGGSKLQDDRAKPAGRTIKKDDDESSIDPFEDTKPKRTKESSSKKEPLNESTKRRHSRKKEAPEASFNNESVEMGQQRGNRSKTDSKMKQQQQQPSESSVDKLSAREKIILKAERYKKQANAKFNKGEFTASRVLYTKGIRTMETLPDHNKGDASSDDDDDALLANMLSNRAVSYFHEKHFDCTIDDCHAAIELQPAVDKPYIRKWRAMMAKGEFDEAYRFIRTVSTQTFPESAKLRQEFNKCRAEKEALEAVKGFMNKGDIANAQATLDNILATKDCDNIVLFVYSARLRITVGDFQPALEMINKALRFNPDFVDALECRGFLYFFTGDMQKAATFLYDAYARHKDCNNLKSAMDRVQTTHQFVQSAEEATKVGNTEKSIELYTKAIQASQPMPPLALLNAHLHIARATQRMEQHQYTEALKDCQTILQVRPKYGPAWAVRSKVMCALGKPEHAYRDLLHQNTWAKDDSDVQRALKDIEHELRVLREEQTIVVFCEELSNGDYRRLLRFPSLHPTSSSQPNSSSKHVLARKTPSNSSLNGNNNSNNNNHPKHALHISATMVPAVNGKTKEVFKSCSDERKARSSSRDFRKSVSSRNGFNNHNSISTFDLKNLTDVNESLQQQQQQHDPNDGRRRNSRLREAKRRQHDSFRELPPDSRRDAGGTSSSTTANGPLPAERRKSRKSNSQSQLKV